MPQDIICATREIAAAATCRLRRVKLPAYHDEETQAVCCQVSTAESLDAHESTLCDVLAEDGTVLHSGVYKVKGADPEPEGQQSEAKGVLASMSWVDKLLPVWVVLAMAIGIILGEFVPGIADKLQVAEITSVSLPIALGLWFMMWPVLTKVRYEALRYLVAHPNALQHFSISFVLNWVVGPLLMTGLAWACLPDLPEYRNGVIMIGLARCIAMVLLWNQLARGDAELCAVTVAFNSIMQILLYAPLALFYLQVVSRGDTVDVSFWLVARSVLIFLGIPLAAGILLRLGLLYTAGEAFFERFMKYFGPVALVALLYTIIVLFAAQGKDMISQIGDVARVSVPLFIYFCIMFFGTAAIFWWTKADYSRSVTQAFTASSNNFELAIAVAAATFGVESQEALAATVGPLIEVPVLLAFVYVAVWAKHSFWDKRDASIAQASIDA